MPRGLQGVLCGESLTAEGDLSSDAGTVDAAASNNGGGSGLHTARQTTRSPYTHRQGVTRREGWRNIWLLGSLDSHGLAQLPWDAAVQSGRHLLRPHTDVYGCRAALRAAPAGHAPNRFARESGSRQGSSFAQQGSLIWEAHHTSLRGGTCRSIGQACAGCWQGGGGWAHCGGPDWGRGRVCLHRQHGLLRTLC